MLPYSERIYIYTYIYMCTHTHTRAHIHRRSGCAYIHTYVCTCVCVCMSEVCVCVCMCLHVQYMCVCLHMYIYICMLYAYILQALNLATPRCKGCTTPEIQLPWSVSTARFCIRVRLALSVFSHSLLNWGTGCSMAVGVHCFSLALGSRAFQA